MRWPIYQASRVLHHQGIIAYPTETVWGLGCDPFSPAALQRIINVKKRDAHKGLILVAADISQFEFLIHDLPENQKEQLNASWPGPFTYLVPHKGRVHPLVHGKFKTVAIRVSSNPIVQELCEYFGGPIVSTSANYSGRPTVQSPLQAARILGHELDFILAGTTGRDRPSRIVDLESGRVIRG